MSRPTIRDVARRAGVSTATVSRVLAGIGTPRPETADAVRRAVQELGYRPSGVARSLRMRRTHTFGLIVTDLQNPFFPELVQAADLAARAIGYSILLGSAAYDEHRATHYLDVMVDRRVDGLIIASSHVPDESRAWLGGSPVPLVILNAESAGAPVTVITSDNRGGTELATRHLIELGHRRIAFVRGVASFTADQPRIEGFRDACRAGGLAASDTPETRGDGQVDGGHRAVAELLRAHPALTAIACYNDVTAIGALRALREAGRSVPGEVSVVGCDDIAAAAWVAPALTTVAQQKAEMGRLAVQRLAAILDSPDDPPPPEVVRLPMSLRVRDSTAPPSEL
jgi:DNA-binding LacI/PurR family transcriptional regulator